MMEENLDVLVLYDYLSDRIGDIKFSEKSALTLRVSVGKPDGVSYKISVADDQYINKKDEFLEYQKKTPSQFWN
jgi:hypothetical protein